MNLTIDIGNTRTKCAIFDGRTEVFTCDFGTTDVLNELQFIFDQNNIDASIVSSVVGSNTELSTYLSAQSRFILFDYKVNLPIINNYETPSTLGLDRLANACALSLLYPDQNALSIDLGTCIKYDFLSNQNEYQGGAISPGLNMRFKAMHTQTALLPTAEYKPDAQLNGTSTEKSIQSGVHWGVLKEIEGIISAYKQQYSNLKVVLTGGDHIHFVKAFKNSIFARPNLTLEGLNEVLIVNE